MKFLKIIFFFILVIFVISRKLKIKNSKRIQITDYSTMKQVFLKILFINTNSKSIDKESLSKSLLMTSDNNDSKKIEVLGKMILCIEKGDPLTNDNKYANQVLNKINDIYDSLNGTKRKIGEECKRIPFFDRDRVCMPGSFCFLNNGVKTCKVGFKKLAHRCNYNWECEDGLICNYWGKCIHGNKELKDELPPIASMEKRLSEVTNNQGGIDEKLVRHRSEIGSVYNLNIYKSQVTQNLTTEQENVRNAMLDYILKNEELLYKAEDMRSKGTFEPSNNKGTITINPKNINEDTTNHELMHFIDYILGKKSSYLKNSNTYDNDKYLSYQIWMTNFKDYTKRMNVEEHIAKNLGILNSYNEGGDRITEFPTNFLQEGKSGVNLVNIKNDKDSKDYIMSYVNEISKNDELKVVADYIKKKIE